MRQVRRSAGASVDPPGAGGTYPVMRSVRVALAVGVAVGLGLVAVPALAAGTLTSASGSWESLSFVVRVTGTGLTDAGSVMVNGPTGCAGYMISVTVDSDTQMHFVVPALAPECNGAELNVAAAASDFSWFTGPDVTFTYPITGDVPPTPSPVPTATPSPSPDPSPSPSVSPESPPPSPSPSASPIAGYVGVNDVSGPALTYLTNLYNLVLMVGGLLVLGVGYLIGRGLGK